MMAFSHQLIECPSVYELMANPEFNWPRVPHLSIWRDYIDSMGQHSVKLESYGPKDLLPILTEALNKNTVMCGFQHVFKFFGKKHKNLHTCWVFNRIPLKVKCSIRIPLEHEIYNYMGLSV